MTRTGAITAAMLVGFVAGIGASYLLLGSDNGRDREEESPPGHLPVESMDIQVGEDLQLTIQAFERLANEESFAIRSSIANPYADHVLIVAWRSDFRIVATNSIDRNKFFVGIYPTCANSEPPKLEAARLREKISVMLSQTERNSRT